MATKRIIWQQKTGASTSDILYPRTDWESIMGKPEIPSPSDYVKKSGDDMTGSLRIGENISESNVVLNEDGVAFTAIAGIGSVRQTTYSNDSITHTEPLGEKLTYNFPETSGTLLVDGDIPDIKITTTGVGNAITSILVDPTNKHNLQATKSTVFATTATATQSANGLMSSTDKKNLDDMVTLFGTTAGDNDTIVNTVRELLAIFNQYPEGTTITQALAGKADKSALNDYVTLNTEQTINASKTIADSYHILFEEGAAIAFPASDERGSNSISFSKYSNDAYVVFSFDDGLSLARCGGIDLDNGWGTDGQVLTSHGRDYPTWESLPTSLPPSGTAGGDLTGTYPNPTIGTGKVTDGKLATNAVTTAKIKDANVTNAKLDTTGITAGTYSVLTINAQGRATAGANLFTVGTSTSIPSSVPTNGFYLQVVS